MNGADLKARRAAMGTSMEVLAARLGVTKRTVARWESGQWDVPIEAELAFQSMWDAWLDKISDAVEQVDDLAILHGDPEAAELSIYRSGESAHRALGDGMTWDEHLAMVAAITTALELSDFTVRVDWAPEEP